jgi:hypothetical protein
MSGINVLHSETERSRGFGPAHEADFTSLECLAIGAKEAH